MLIVADAKNSFVNAAFAQLGELRVLPTPEIRAETLRHADAVIVRSETAVNAALLEGTAVRFVGTATIGTDHVDLDYLRQRGIAFAHAPGSNANSVAEYLIAGLLVIAERRSTPLEEMSIAVVGVGNVGGRVEKMARALGMKVLLNDPPLARTTLDARYRPLEEVIGADIVTLHVPLTRQGVDATVHLFDGSTLARMTPGAVLVNTSRGAVAETAALREALHSGHLGGAILDVWEREPSIDWNLFERATIGTPHIAGYSLDGKVCAARMLFERMRDHFAISAEWPAALDLPAPRHPSITLKPSGRSSQELVHEAVAQCYDILRDHRSLEAASREPAERRPDAFRRLRATYPDRREFFNSTVHLEAGDRTLAGRLSALGFRLGPEVLL
jgi:erythronate-4-phosphate dehydrogenase